MTTAVERLNLISALQQKAVTVKRASASFNSKAEKLPFGVTTLVATDLPAMDKALRAVLDVHVTKHAVSGTAYCGACQVTHGVWPCRTVQAIEEALGDELGEIA